jgi:hypothetical protein
MVMINGQPLTINWENKYVPAILEAWFPSVQSGQVIAETLFGDNNPGGKLPSRSLKLRGKLSLTSRLSQIAGRAGRQKQLGQNQRERCAYIPLVMA